MALEFTGASPRLEHVGTLHTDLRTAPITMACWFRADTVTSAHTLISLANEGATDQIFILQLLGTVAGDPIRAFARNGGTMGDARTASGYTANTWHHACAVFASTTSRTCYIDGVGGTTDTTSVAPSGITGLDIGRSGDATPGAYMDGRIAEVGLWAVALNASDIASLAAGWPPNLVGSSNALLHYFPLYQDVSGVNYPTFDAVSNGLTLSSLGVSHAVDHPPVLHVAEPIYIPGAAAEIWIERGGVWLFTLSNWGTRTWYFEATIRANSAGQTAKAKLYDVTAAADVASSEVTTTNTTATRVRSGAITLVDGHEYEVRYGSFGGSGGKGRGGRLIGVL